MESAVLRERYDRYDRGRSGHHHDDGAQEDRHQRGGRGRQQQRRGVEAACRTTRPARGEPGEDEHLESALPAENPDPVHRRVHQAHR